MDKISKDVRAVFKQKEFLQRERAEVIERARIRRLYDEGAR